MEVSSGDASGRMQSAADGERVSFEENGKESSQDGDDSQISRPDSSLC